MKFAYDDLNCIYFLHISLNLDGMSFNFNLEIYLWDSIIFIGHFRNVIFCLKFLKPLFC